MPAARQLFPWKLPAGDITLGARTLLMAVLDLSNRAIEGKPDPAAILEQAFELENEGADFIDLTVADLRPQSMRVTPDQELSRLTAALRKLRAAVKAPLCVTTYNAETAARAVELGAAIIRDPSGLSVDAEMARAINAGDAALIVGHAPGPPESWHSGRPAARLLDGIVADLDSSIGRARRAGVDPRRVAVDPGLGFGKKGLQNYAVLDHLRRLQVLARPLVVSPTQQLFLTESVRSPRRDWVAAAVAVGAVAIQAGVHVVRTTELPEMRAAAKAADRILETREAER